MSKEKLFVFTAIAIACSIPLILVTCDNPRHRKLVRECMDQLEASEFQCEMLLRAKSVDVQIAPKERI